MKFLWKTSIAMLVALGLRAQEKGPYIPLGQERPSSPLISSQREKGPYMPLLSQPTTTIISQPNTKPNTSRYRIGNRRFATRTYGTTFPDVPTQVGGEFGAEDIPTYQPVKMSLAERIKSWFTPARSAQEVRQNLQEKLSKSISENSAFRAVSDAITSLGKNVYGIKDVDFKAYIRRAWNATAVRAWSSIQERALAAYNYAQRELNRLRGTDRAGIYERAYQITPQGEKEDRKGLLERIKQRITFAAPQESDRARQSRTEELGSLPTRREIEYTRAYKRTETDPFVEQYYEEDRASAYKGYKPLELNVRRTHPILISPVDEAESSLPNNQDFERALAHIQKIKN